MYYGLYSYISYFSAKHPKVIENADALEAAYNIRLGTQLAPIGPREDVIEEVEEIQAARGDEFPSEVRVVEDLEGGMFAGFSMTQEKPIEEKVDEKP